ncbi:hypothetical protein GW17_00060811 [Ensete ventricosum]|nr:hypothetical protein GW17_00060811 [Ensete ventricosum]
MLGTVVSHRSFFPPSLPPSSPRVPIWPLTYHGARVPSRGAPRAPMRAPCGSRDGVIKTLLGVFEDAGNCKDTLRKCL